jgi:hypothetical protein
VDGYEWFQAGLGVAVAAYGVGYGVSTAIRASKAKAICSQCEEEIDQERVEQEK